ncbi:MAG: alpha-L-fucosidase [Dysgonomonas sp.]
MKNIFLLVGFLFILTAIHGQNAQQIDITKKMEWWNDAKFGMFIHWGPYSIYGGEYHGYKQNIGGVEWIMNRCKIPVMEYKAAASTFNPTKFDADALVKQAKDAGMKYIVITTKHHDGFAMFKSNASNFNIVDYTPYKKDIIKLLADACRKADIKLGFYYSQSQDWCHPGGSTARKLMREGWANPDSVYVDIFSKANGGAWDAIQRTSTFDEYFNKIAIPQIKEILTNYGDIAIVFWDTPMQINQEQAKKVEAIMAEYPQIIQNDRLRRPDFPGDYKTPEGRIPKAEDIEGVYWETCDNIGSSWGYKSWEDKWKSPETLIRNLITIAARGGNYLLNVGPDAEGVLPKEAVSRLKEIGRWIDVNGEAIYGTQRSLLYPSWGECIRKDSGKATFLYLCVFDWPDNGVLELDTKYKAKSATMLCNNDKLVVRNTNNKIQVSVPSKAPDKLATVIKLELSNKMSLLNLRSNTELFFEITDQKN